MESPVAARFPDMRKEVVGALRALSDPDYQHRVWIRREYPHAKFYDDLTHRIHILFDDMVVLPDPEPAVGAILYPGEASVVRALGAVFGPLIDELGNVGDAEYLAHPRWAEVVRRADDAYRVLHANDQRHATEGPPSGT